MRITKRQLRRIIKESLNEALPPHLQKHFRDDGSSVRDPEWKDVTPAGYGPDNEPGDYVYGMIKDYEDWVSEQGHVTPAASSVLAGYFVELGLENDHNAHQMLADHFNVDHDDIMRDITRQQQERSATVGESIRDNHEGMSPEHMPDAWRQILGSCLKEKG
jgi:hypothetical protein